MLSESADFTSLLNYLRNLTPNIHFLVSLSNITDLCLSSVVCGIAIKHFIRRLLAQNEVYLYPGWGLDHNMVLILAKYHQPNRLNIFRNITQCTRNGVLNTQHNSSLFMQFRLAFTGHYCMNSEIYFRDI